MLSAKRPKVETWQKNFSFLLLRSFWPRHKVCHTEKSKAKGAGGQWPGTHNRGSQEALHHSLVLCRPPSPPPPVAGRGLPFPHPPTPMHHPYTLRTNSPRPIPTTHHRVASLVSSQVFVQKNFFPHRRRYFSACRALDRLYASSPAAPATYGLSLRLGQLLRRHYFPQARAVGSCKGPAGAIGGGADNHKHGTAVG